MKGNVFLRNPAKRTTNLVLKDTDNIYLEMVSKAKDTEYET